MTERIIYAVLALALAGLSAVFALEAHDQYVEHARHREFAAWTQSPGTLKSLRLRQVSNKGHRPYRIDVNYVFGAAGSTHTGGQFELHAALYPSADEAKARVQSALAGVDPARWRAVQRDPFVDWVLDPAEAAVTVRHAAADPQKSSLTPAAPRSALFNWLVIAVLCGGALLTGLASPVLVLAMFPKGAKPPAQAPPTGADAPTP